MASTSSTSSTSSLFGNNRSSGLISGLDTESLVKSMAANTMNRINSKKQKLQTLQWKQESYRTNITAISDFQTKFLTIGSTSSIKANSNMSKFSATSSNSKLIASASTSALAATYTISSATAASKAKIASSGIVSDNSINLDFSKNTEGETYDVDVTLDGTKRTVSFIGSADEATSKQNFLDAMNSTFSDLKTDSQGFEFSENSSKLMFNSNSDGIFHTFEIGYNSEAVGLSNNTSNRMSSSSTLGDINFTTPLSSTNSDGSYKLSINGVDFSFSKNTTIAAMTNEINSSKAGVTLSFSSVTQSFKLESNLTGTQGKIEISQTDSNLLNSLFNDSSADYSDAVYGANGTVTISSDGENFVTYTSASNSYTLDGTTIDISKLGTFSAESEEDNITVTTERDISSIKDTIVNFVEGYNKLLTTVYGTINTARPKSNGSYYDPLTDEQKEEMEKSEIESWEENAKKGLLYHDSSLTTFVSSLRTAMTTSVDGFSLSDLGITVSKDSTAFGQLVIDSDKLEASIKSYGDEISKFFTDTTNGLAAKVNTQVDKAISKTTNKYGYLTQLAGIENTNSEKKNTIYTQINGLQTIIDNLQDRYDSEIDRYWNQFTALETYMSKMQSQSSYFTSDY